MSKAYQYSTALASGLHAWERLTEIIELAFTHYVYCLNSLVYE